ncbi:probable LRR receptor-like serine/threonine-protein kinase At3g47570 [Hibiscus syriacus]|uniref:probable LRR receptor-like serine/threonine-protein kinase At3g47570 n=1 Tax=Hibiscus syriacus TaxID=106335 RepID=UPI001921B41A|nr:probable LRR receptor-like serine/threonine-protein kinase At3g47570 [Hibiscus syriacus]
MCIKSPKNYSIYSFFSSNRFGKRKQSHSPSSSSKLYFPLMSTPKNQCLNALDIATTTPVVRGNDTDQQALLQFKAKITGDQLKIMESWNSSIHFCQWRGVTCSRKHQRVTKLELQYLEFSGSLSPYIGNLSFLMELSLAGNSFYSEIPHEIGRLRRLETLNLTDNSINGKIPSNLPACSKLTIVDMRSNRLTGEIPAALGLLSNLKFLSFYNNSLRGNIPPSLRNISSLEKLGLSLNSLSGIIPEALGRLKNLSYLVVGQNEISGQHSFKSRQVLNVAIFGSFGNNLSGQIPSQVLRLPSLTILLIFKPFNWKKKEKNPTPICAENSLLQLSYQNLLRATNGFSTHNLVGSGNFGSVYKGILEESGATIAVKVLNLLNRGASRSFLTECEALKNIRYRNLVKVLTAVSGVDYKGNDFKALIYEFMENGSLEDWLHPSITMNEPETVRNLNFI